MFRRILIATCIAAHLLLSIVQRSSLAGFLAWTNDHFVHVQLFLLAVTCVAALCSRQVWSRVGRHDMVLLLLIASYGVSVVLTTFSRHSISPTTIEVLLTPLTIFCFTWAVPKALHRRDFEFVFVGVVTLFAVHTLLTAFLVATNTHCLFGKELYCTTGRPQLYWHERGALLTGLFANPNGIASYLLLLPGIAFAMSTRFQHKWKKVSLISAGALLLINILLLMSRACSLTVLAALGAAGLLSKNFGKINRPAALAGLVSCLFIACYAMLNWKSDTSIVLRTWLWDGFAHAAMENPFGSGWNGVEIFGQNPHSMWIANWVYFGIFGVVQLILLLSVLLKQAVATCRQDRACLVLLLSLVSMLLIHQTAEYVITYPLLFSNSIFWLLLGYLQIPLQHSEPAQVASQSPGTASLNTHNFLP